MKTYIRRREKNDELVVLFGTWGTDENVFLPFCNDNFDFILFYDYSADEALVLPDMKTYRKITLIGWSLGVWAAEYLMPKINIIPDTTIAVNGTPIPADDRYGIPLKEFQETLDNISEENMDRFYFRMFGDKRTYRKNKDKVSHRSIKSLHDELRWLYNRMMEQKEPGFRWDYSIISEPDKIFPFENMISYWKKQEGTKYILVRHPHYIFPSWSSFAEFVSFVKKHKRKLPDRSAAHA